MRRGLGGVREGGRFRDLAMRRWPKKSEKP